MRVLVFGPMISGHISNWIHGSKEYIDYRIVTLHYDKSISENVGIGEIYKIPRLTKTKFDFIYAPVFLLFYFFLLKPELVHVHFFSSYGLISCVLPRKVKKILSVWGSDINNTIKKRGILGKIYVKAMKSFCVVNSPARHITNKIISYFNVNQERIHTFQYGVDVGFFSDEKTSSIRDDKCITITSVRNWDNIYNIESFLEAVIDMKDYDCKGYFFNINILGRSSSKTTHDKIIELTKKCEGDNYKVNLIGFIQKEELRSILHKSDFVLSIPSNDGAPLSLMEGVLCNCFPIVSDIDANRELLGNHAMYLNLHDDIDMKSVF
ncbi:glycosyltransferase, partial [Escherichia coli]|nr:glycosyltransferase [Escherichia coli]